MKERNGGRKVMKKGNNERRIEIKKGRKQMKEINERKK